MTLLLDLGLSFPKFAFIVIQTVPHVRDDPADIAMIPFDFLWYQVGSDRVRAEQDKCIAGSLDVAR
mgnify:CR=1 FL=1